MVRRLKSPKKAVRVDISNKAVVVVLIIVILVSIASLGVYLRSLDSISNAAPKDVSAGQGTVGFTVVEAPSAPQIVSESGEVGFTVVKPNYTINK